VAASAFGVRATIVMPRTTPLAKVEATRSYGGDVVLFGDSYDDARREAMRIAEERRLLTIPAYDDALIVAGQGTVGVEIAEDMPDVDIVLVPVGGGGLAAGVAVAVTAAAAHARVIGVQVEAAPGVRVSRDAGSATSIAPGPTIAEGIAVGGPGDVTFPLLQRYLDDVVLVDEDDVAQAMVLLMERSKMVVEGAGAVGVAALMSGKVSRPGSASRWCFRAATSTST
jgi:threonine dehydratase